MKQIEEKRKGCAWLVEWLIAPDRWNDRLSDVCVRRCWSVHRPTWRWITWQPRLALLAWGWYGCVQRVAKQWWVRLYRREGISKIVPPPLPPVTFYLDYRVWSIEVVVRGGLFLGRIYLKERLLLLPSPIVTDVGIWLGGVMWWLGYDREGLTTTPPLSLLLYH